MEWTPIESANRYHLQVVERDGVPLDEPRPPASFDTSLFTDDSMITDSKYKLSGTGSYKEYTCRLRAFNDKVSSPWLVKAFTTEKVTEYKDKQMEKFYLRIIPNPTYSNVNISGLGFGAGKIEIYNLMGEEVLNDDLRIMNNEFKKEINISAFPHGIYFLKATTGSRVEVVKFVKLE